jgi:hypothetical protein
MKLPGSTLINFFFLFYFIPFFSWSQVEDTWTAFEDEPTGLYGFRNSKGSVMVEPNFMGYMLRAKRFSNIIAVTDKDNLSYYLLKSGIKKGMDSMYIYDTAFDCESEGFIRFQDTKTNRIGIFNSEGEIAIPPDYDALTPIRNGLAVGLKGAVKKFNDEHWILEGGGSFLIDKNNKILVVDFTSDLPVDYHSLKIEEIPSDDSCRESFPGVDGKYYTFINNEKIFKQWLLNFVKELNADKIIRNSYSKIIYWTDENGWIAEESSTFVRNNFKLLKERLSMVLKPDTDYFISAEEFITFPGNMDNELEEYLDNCGDLKYTQYPLMNVVISNKSHDDLSQDNFSFLKTENGFKLLNISFSKVIMN